VDRARPRLRPCRRRPRQGSARIVRTTTQAEQSVTFSVSRLLVQNYEAEDQAMAHIQQIYVGVERNVYLFVAAMLLSLSLITLYLIYSNRRLFERLASLSGERRDLARKLITMQEEVLRSISRELHDEFGQILTAIGAMLTRAAKQNVPDSFKEDVREVRDVAQQTLERVRSLSLVLHPSILDEADWSRPSTGIFRSSRSRPASPSPTIRRARAKPSRYHRHSRVRVLQEALNNVARHARSATVSVRLHLGPAELELEVRDHGVGRGRAKIGPDGEGSAWWPCASGRAVEGRHRVPAPGRRRNPGAASRARGCTRDGRSGGNAGREALRSE